MCRALRARVFASSCYQQLSLASKLGCVNTSRLSTVRGTAASATQLFGWGLTSRCTSSHAAGSGRVRVCDTHPHFRSVLIPCWYSTPLVLQGIRVPSRTLVTVHDDPWAILGVARGASEKELKMAYFRKAKLCHPDVGGDTEEFKRLGQAYELCRRWPGDRSAGSQRNRGTKSQQAYEGHHSRSSGSQQTNRKWEYAGTGRNRYNETHSGSSGSQQTNQKWENAGTGRNRYNETRTEEFLRYTRIFTSSESRRFYTDADAQKTWNDVVGDAQLASRVFTDYTHELKMEAAFLRSCCQAGEWKEAWTVVSRHKGVVAVGAALLMVLRVPPPLVAAALTSLRKLFWLSFLLVGSPWKVVVLVSRATLPITLWRQERNKYVKSQRAQQQDKLRKRQHPNRKG